MAVAARNLLLKHLRVQVQTVPSNPSSTAPLFLSPFAAIRRRLFSEEVRGTFLDKSEVTDRVVSVVKNFQKVDPSKVYLSIYNWDKSRRFSQKMELNVCGNHFSNELQVWTSSYLVVVVVKGDHSVFEELILYL